MTVQMKEVISFRNRTERNGMGKGKGKKEKKKKKEEAEKRGGKKKRVLKTLHFTVIWSITCIR